MPRTPNQLRDDALAIWQAGVDAVRSDRLLQQAVRVEGGELLVDDHAFDLSRVGRIVVVGAGKAGAGMAHGLEEALGEQLMQAKQLAGWVNVPADCVRRLRRIHLHAARPAGVNEPRPEGVAGTGRMLELVQSLGADDLCIVLVSGGGSALMPRPVEAITLDDKLDVTQALSAGGANIHELNVVRKQLSQIKGGGLARACRAGQLLTLILSDVLGDPLDTIASGPTVADRSTPTEALEILERFAARGAEVPERVREYLARSSQASADARPGAACQVTNVVIANNATAVDAAGAEAVRRGYRPAMVSAREPEGPAEDVGRHLARMALAMRSQAGPDCLVSGGEPTVRLAPPERRGKGGRNQQLVLAALGELCREDRSERPLAGIVLLSGGTDGEDGPTDAAGAWIDAEVYEQLALRGLSIEDHLQRNDAYRFFEPLRALLKTGPTHTNVCDLRVIVVEQR